MIWKTQNIVGRTELSISGQGEAASALRTVWPGNSILSIPENMLSYSFASSDAEDSVNGTGARFVRIRCLNSNLQESDYLLALNGTTPVELPNNLTAIESIEIVECGSLGVNKGVISVGTGNFTSGVPDVVYDLIPIEMGASQSCRYTVPKGKIFVLHNISVTPGNAIVDFVVEVCKTKYGATSVYYQGSDFDGNINFTQGETFSLRIKLASVEDLVYVIAKGELKSL